MLNKRKRSFFAMKFCKFGEETDALKHLKQCLSKNIIFLYDVIKRNLCLGKLDPQHYISVFGAVTLTIKRKYAVVKAAFNKVFLEKVCLMVLLDELILINFIFHWVIFFGGGGYPMHSACLKRVFFIWLK